MTNHRQVNKISGKVGGNKCNYRPNLLTLHFLLFLGLGLGFGVDLISGRGFGFGAGLEYAMLFNPS
jgi:hypothetical protein